MNGLTISQPGRFFWYVKWWENSFGGPIFHTVGPIFTRRGAYRTARRLSKRYA